MKKIGVFLLSWGPIILALAGVWLGYSYINQVSAQEGWDFLWVLGVVLVTIAAAVVGLILNIVFHEGGHLIGGLLTGHSFVSYGVLNLTIVRENGKLAVKKYRVAGTGGGVTLSPPDMKNGTYPYKLYISSGFLVNFLVSAICLSLFFYLAGTAPFWARAFLVVGVIGAFLGLVTFIPTNDPLPSDGYFLFNLGKTKNTVMRRGMWSCSRMQALVAEGTRPRDIPTDFFDWVDTGNITDMFVFGAANFQYSYLLDKQELSDARSLMQTLCDNLQGVPEMHKMSCYCELLFHELIGECRQEEIDRLYDKNLKDYIKAAQSEVSVQRTMYAYARLVSKDADKAKEHLALFHKACTAPFQSGIVPGERALIAFIDAIAEKWEKLYENASR